MILFSYEQLLPTLVLYMAAALVFSVASLLGRLPDNLESPTPFFRRSYSIQDAMTLSLPEIDDHEEDGQNKRCNTLPILRHESGA